MLNIIRLTSCASTSAELATMPLAPDGTMVVTDCQTAGRGQRGNTWEAEPGRNLTFSLLMRPALPAARQFELSMLVSLAIADVLSRYIDPARVKIKWPNDIYVDNGKICGILIENTLAGAGIERSIVGVGINVNQQTFTSDAPNPVSMIHFTGRELTLDKLLGEFADEMMTTVHNYLPSPQPQYLKKRYMAVLYHHDGLPHRFCHPGGEAFEAAIVDVGIDGMLRLSNGRAYAFKEVAYIL